MIAKLFAAEPVIFITFISSLITFLVGLGLVSQSHGDELIKVAAIAVPIILQLAAGLLARSRVSPVAKP